MFVDCASIVRVLEQWLPRKYALPDDPGGLQIGSLNADVRKVMVTLDVTVQVVEEAIREHADLIVAHHPVIFQPLGSIRTDTPAGKVVELCMKHGIGVYAAHTNLDIAPGGMGDMMADALGLQNTNIFVKTMAEQLYKLIVFIPEDHAEPVREAMFAAGAGQIGEYSHCSFNLAGTGTFLPGDKTNPYIGSQGSISKVPEIRVETIVPEARLPFVVEAMTAAHPYEEPAYDVFRLELDGPAYGLGRTGEWPAPMKLEQVADQVKSAFGLAAVRIVGDPGTTIRQAAVLGGSGRRYVPHAVQAGVDVYITGDIDFHTAQDALASGLCLIDPGHHSERIMIGKVAQYLEQKLSDLQSKTVVMEASTNTDPFRFR